MHSKSETPPLNKSNSCCFSKRMRWSSFLFGFRYFTILITRCHLITGWCNDIVSARPLFSLVFSSCSIHVLLLFYDTDTQADASKLHTDIIHHMYICVRCARSSNIVPHDYSSLWCFPHWSNITGIWFALQMSMWTTFALLSGCFIACTLHYHTQHCLIVSFMYKAAFPPPADVGWSMNDGGISAVGRRRLEYEL